METGSPTADDSDNGPTAAAFTNVSKQLAAASSGPADPEAEYDSCNHLTRLFIAKAPTEPAPWKLN